MSEKKTQQDKPAKAAVNALKYSGIAFQMIGTIVVLAFLGRYADSYWGLQTPYCTIVGALFGVAGSMFSLFKQLSNDNK